MYVFLLYLTSITNEKMSIKTVLRIEKTQNTMSKMLNVGTYRQTRLIIGTATLKERKCLFL